MVLLWLTLLAVHTGLAGLWWWLMPHGFPSSAPEHFTNEIAPVLVIVVMVTALVARGKFSEVILPPVLLAIPLFWMACGIALRLDFIDSWASGWSPLFIGGAIVLGLWVRHFRYRLRAKWPLPIFGLVALIAGAEAPNALRSPDPTTKPAGGTMPAAPATSTLADHKLIKLSKDAQVRPDDGRIVVKRDKVIMNLMPMLTFNDRSPDRTWTAWAPEGTSKPTSRIYVGKTHEGGRASLYYKDEDASVLDVGFDGGKVELDARSRLAKPIFSHVNDMLELTVQGQQKLSVAFSPTGNQRIEVPSAKANARFAYLDGSGTFHVVEAEKRRRGPWKELASGALSPSQSLTMTLYDGDKAVFAVTLQDWAAQASTALSPTAGWGVAQNAIELMRGGDAENTPALITATLASTALGQGTATVGYVDGVYRNRITIALP